MKRSFFIMSASSALVAASVIPTEEAQRFWAMGAPQAQVLKGRMISYFEKNEAGLLIPMLVPYTQEKVVELLASVIPRKMTGFKVITV